MASKDILTRSQALLSGFLVMFLLIFSSCDKLIDLLEGGDDEEENAIIELPYSPTSWEVSYKGQTVSVEFTASEDWRIVIDEYTSSWISVSPTEGSAGDYTLDISVSANETSEQRNGFVTIYSGDERVDIYVTQYGFETVLDVPDSQAYWEISNAEAVIYVNFFTNNDWSVEIDESSSSWISVSPMEGVAGECTLEISVSENNTYEPRYGTVTIVSGNEKRGVSIMQNRFEAILDIPDYQTYWDINNEETVLKVNLLVNTDWSVEIDESSSSWISVSPMEGEAGEYTLEIFVSENSTYEPRDGTVTIVSGDERRDINIVQNRLETILDIPDSQSSWDISNAETALKVNLITNVDWSVEIEESTASWVSVDPSKGTAGEYVLDIHVSANETEEMRHGMLTVVSGNERREIYINQKGKTFQPEGEGPDDMPIEEWK